MRPGNIFKRFKTDTKGNVSIMFAASFVATLTLIGAVFDLALLNKTKQQIRYLTDAASLAALQFNGTNEEKETAFRDYIRSASRLSNGEELLFTSDVNVEVRNGALTLDARISSPYEFVMLQHLGAPPLIDIVTTAEKGIEDTEIALVLDISSSMNGARITEAKAAAKLFIDQLLSNPELEDRVGISIVPFGGTVRVPVELSTLLETPLSELNEDFSQHWIGGEWNQCFEFQANDTELGINPNGAYKETPDFWSWNRTNPWCPTRGNELTPLSNDKDVLTAKVDAFTLSDGTGSDHGLAWGIETLNPAWRGNFPGALDGTPANFTDRTKKVIIFMTDGGITSQHRVRDQDRVGTPPYNSKRRNLISAANTTNAFNKACDRAKASGIEIYTIAFNIRNNNHKSTVENCASAPSAYVDAGTGQLASVFENLANEVSPLRLTN